MDKSELFGLILLLIALLTMIIVGMPDSIKQMPLTNTPSIKSDIDTISEHDRKVIAKQRTIDFLMGSRY